MKAKYGIRVGIVLILLVCWWKFGNTFAGFIALATFGYGLSNILERKWETIPDEMKKDGQWGLIASSLCSSIGEFFNNLGEKIKSGTVKEKDDETE